MENSLSPANESPRKGEGTDTMQISDDLKREHQLILRYIDLMERYMDFASATPATTLLFEKADIFIDFIQNFADGLHHAKEEGILFKFLAKPEVLTHCNPLPQMLMEHALGRDCVKGMKNAMTHRQSEPLLRHTGAYCSLLKEHIFKEDHILFPMAEEGIRESEKENVFEEYQTIEGQLDARSLWQKFERKLSELESSLKAATEAEVAQA
jgi:hemerythrin-like domain-containing protein